MPETDQVTMLSRWEEDVEDTAQSILPLCTYCVHRENEKSTCTAFPGGIPLIFLTSQEDHTEIKWDETVTFKDNGKLPDNMRDRAK